MAVYAFYESSVSVFIPISHTVDSKHPGCMCFYKKANKKKIRDFFLKKSKKQ